MCYNKLYGQPQFKKDIDVQILDKKLINYTSAKIQEYNGRN